MGRIENGEESLTVREAAELLECHPNTVRNLIKREILVRRKFLGDNRVYVTKKSLGYLRSYKLVPITRDGALKALKDLMRRVEILEREVEVLKYR